MKKNWRYSKRALVLKALAHVLGIPDMVVTKVVHDDGSLEPGMCFREPYHEGPCNGYPTDTCWQHHPG